MKRVFFLLIFILSISRAYPLELKFMGGIDFSKSTLPLALYWAESTGPTTAKYGTGAILGCGIEFSLSQNIALEVDGFYFQKGSRFEHTDFTSGGVVQGMARINELSFAGLLKIALKPGTSPYLVGGGEYAFVFSTGPKKTDYGLVFGVGFRKQVKKSFVSLEARYHLGLQDTLTDNSFLRKMRALVLMVGFSI